MCAYMSVYPNVYSACFSSSAPTAGQHRGHTLLCTSLRTMFRRELVSRVWIVKQEEPVMLRGTLDASQAPASRPGSLLFSSWDTCFPSSQTPRRESSSMRPCSWGGHSQSTVHGPSCAGCSTHLLLSSLPLMAIEESPAEPPQSSNPQECRTCLL